MLEIFDGADMENSFYSKIAIWMEGKYETCLLSSIRTVFMVCVKQIGKIDVFIWWNNEET